LGRERSGHCVPGERERERQRERGSEKERVCVRERE